MLGKGYYLNTRSTIFRDKLVISGGPTPLLFASTLKNIIANLDVLSGSMKFPDMAVEFTPSIIDDASYNPNWTYGDSSYSHQSPITNFSVNENCQPRSNRSHEFSLSELHEKENNFTPVNDPEKHFSDMIRELMTVYHGSNYSSKFSLHNDAYNYEESIRDIIQHMEKVSCNTLNSKLLSEKVHE